jgi:hypothetical protein
MKLSAAQLPVAIGLATLVLGVPSTLAGEAALRDRGAYLPPYCGMVIAHCEPASALPSVPPSRTAAPTTPSPFATVASTTPSNSPSLTTVTAERPEVDVQNLGPSGIHESLFFASLSGNFGLHGRILRATDDGTPVIFTQATLGTLIESGHGVSISSDAPGSTELDVENHTGRTGIVRVTVDGVPAFSLPGGE